MTWNAYQCSVEHTGVSITWDVNKTGYGHNEIIQFGILTMEYHNLHVPWDITTMVTNV